MIASSFGDIHANNCVRNGLLPVVLKKDEVAAIRAQLHAGPGATVSVDLAAQTVTDAAGGIHHFNIYPVRKKCLSKDWMTSRACSSTRKGSEGFEEACCGEQPWLRVAGGKP